MASLMPLDLNVDHKPYVAFGMCVGEEMGGSATTQGCF